MKRIIQKHHIRKIKHITAISAVTFFVAIFSYIFLPSQAAFNKQINYQGKLSASSGVAVANGTYNMEFKLYTASSGGSAIWTETRINANRVTVTNGLFSIMLGEVSPLTGVDFNQTLYLGVNIGGTAVSPSWDGEMSPRKILGVVPAAVESERTGGFIPSQTPTGNNIPVLSAGNLTLTGSINAPTFQGNGAAVTFGNGTYGTTIAGNSLIISPTSWTATPTISGLVTLTSGLTSNGTMTANGVVSLGDGGDNISINSNNWSISSAGAISGVTTISLSGQITSNIATGTSPFSVTSTTVNTNLNADLLDGHSSSYFATDSSLNSYVPYSGATSNINLGTYSLTTPTILGGSTTTSPLTLQTTSGVGTTGADMHFKVGNNGGTEAMTILNDGSVGVGIVSPASKLDVNGILTVGTGAGVTRTGSILLGDGYITKNYGESWDFGGGLYSHGGGMGFDRNDIFFVKDSAGIDRDIFGARPATDPSSAFMTFLKSPDNDPDDGIQFRNYANSPLATILDGGNFGIGVTNPTASLHLKAGTTTAGTAPLKFTAGTNLGTTEAGAVEYDGSHLYFTASNGGSRYQLDQQGGTGANSLGSYIVQTATNAPANSQVLASLGTGLIKNTTGTGVLSIASAGTDYQAPLVSGTNIKTINGSSVLGSGDLAITGMIYPSAGIAVSTGSAWTTSITDNSANWNTAYGWGNHASGGYVKTDQTSGQTIGTTGARLTKLWATDITVTNAITGSVTGSAGSVSGLTLTTNLTNNGGAGVLTWPAAGATLVIPTGGGTLGSNAFTSTAYLPSASFTDAAVTGKLITGFVSGAGTVAATDTILQAIQKLNGNIAANGNGTVTSVSTAAANNGVTATWSMASPTPALTIGLGAITPTSVNGLTLTAAADGFTIAGGTTSRTLTVTGAAASISGTHTGTSSGSNTGDQTTITGNAGSATYASSVTLTADNSTNATNYPLFTNAATGNLSPRTDTGFTYNPSTGLLTSTAFSGTLTGNVTGNVSGSAATFTGSLAGDVTGTQGATVVGDNSHSHDGTTISGLAVADFTSSNLSLWTNDLGWITSAGTAANFSGSLSGEVTGGQGTTVIGNAAVIGKVLTGYVSGAGTVAATDTILQAIQKLNGNIAANGNGTVTSVSTAAANNGVTATWSMASPTPALTIGLGAITPTSVNGLTLNAAATGFTIAGGTTSKTLTINNTLGFSGTDGSTLNIGTGGTLGTAAYTASTAYQPSNTNLTSLSGLTYASTSFVKMTAAGTFALDTNTYLTSASSLTAGNLTGTIPSAVLGNSTVYVGTTAIALNRASANLGLTGISSIALPGATSGTITLTPAATAGATAITIPATSGTLITTGDSGTVTGTMITNDTVALTTDTSGNYVASANTSALTGLTGGSAGSEGAGLTLGFSYATALSGDPALAANNIIFGTNGMIWEGSAADTFETYLAITNPTVDRTITIQDNSGVIPLGTAANTLFFTTTAATSVTLPTTGTLATLAGSEAFSNKTYNGLTITANGTNTLNIAAGKTLTVSNSIAIAGTDSTTMTFPTTSATIARTDAAQTFIGIQTFSGAITANGGINTAAATALNIVTGTTGALTLDTGTTGAINIGTDANAKTINIGNTGAAAKTILIGNSAQANTITIGSASATGVSITDNNWSINTTGAASLVSVNNLVLSQDNTDFNVKVGTNAGLNLVSGAQFNTFLGYEAGKSAAAGGTNAADWNTAVGYGAFSANTTGQANTANGFLSLASNTTGSANTASGIFSLNANMIGSANTANGIYSLGSNTADGNSAYGYYSLSTNTTGTANTAIGYEAGRYIANGSTSNLTSDYSVYLGSNTKAGADNNQNEIVIGYNAIGKGSNTVTLGNSSITGTYLNGDVSTTSRMFVGVTSEATSSSKLYVEGTTAADGSASAIAGILGGYTFNPTAGGVQVGNRFVVTNSPTTTANTAVGEIIRIVDNTSLANTVRGLDVTANGGGNSAGVNTGIRGSGSTFGIQGTTTALGGGLSVPAAIYGESTGTTQGDILRLYSNSVTSAPSFATFYHDTSAFTGTGLLMDFATGSGSFTGDFANFQKNSTSLFKVTNTGIVSLGLSSTASTSAVCSSLANGTSPTSGVSYELRDCSNTPVADYAEMYPVEEGIEYGDIVVTGKETVNTYDVGSDGGIDWTKIKGNVTKLVKSDEPYQGNVIGIVSDNHSDFSSVGYNIKNEDNPMPIALNGRVPVKVSLSSRAIKAGDYITTSDEKGKATKATKAGFVIGKALEDWSSSSGKNTVMMFVEQGYYNGISISDFAGISLDITQEGSDKIFSKQILEKLLEDEENAKINTSEILVDRLVAALGIITPSITTNTLSAEGEVEFGGLVFFNASASFAKEVKFDDVVEFNVPPLFNNDTAGFAIIKKGATTVDVTFDKPYIATPVVNTTITFEKNKEDTDQFNASDFFGEDLKFIVVDKDENGFTIMLNKVSQFDVSFSWTALAVKDPKIFESVIDGLVIEQESSAASEVASAIDTTNNTSTEGVTPTVENSSDTTIIDEIINSNIVQNLIGGGDVSYTASDTESSTTDQTPTVTDEVPSSPLVVDTETSSEVVSAPSSEPSTPSEPSQVSSPTVE